jgi:hypothetical protein
MDKAEHYLRQAEHFRKKALAESDPEIAEKFRRMAISYEDLARNVWIYAKLAGAPAAE